jgi:hypothetical protein
MPSNAGVGVQVTLDQIGISVGTDKSSLVQNYLVHYERMFRDLRDHPITLLEIGIMNGASLDMWEQYFPNATIIGVDIDPSCIRFGRDRVKVEIGSQDDPEFLASIAAYKPDIIIDDGSHRADHMIFTFERMFPALRPGGCYVVEDIGAHGHPGAEQFRGTSTINPIDYFVDLQRPLVTSWLPPEKRSGIADYLSRTVVRSEVTPSLVAVWKAPVRSAPDLDRLEELTARSGKGEAWQFLSHYLERLANNPARAVRAAEHGVSLMPTNAWAHYRLSQAQHSNGNLEGAMASARDAVAHAPGSEPFAGWLNRLVERNSG